MTTKLFKAAIIAASTLVMAASLSAPAAARSKSSACKAYARLATQMFYEAKASQCGFAGPRWHPFTAAHKAWCMGVSRARSDRGHAYRVNKLNKCQGVEEGD